MPAASSEKRARQRANKLLRMETETAALPNALQPAQTTPESSETATSTPTCFTISYTPLLNPEPAATRSGTNAIQVTQFELSKILRQAFQQGSEASEQRYQLELADAMEKLKMQYEDRLAESLNDFAERMQESTDIAYGEEYSAGILEEQEHRESAHVSQVNVTTQTDPVITPISVQISLLNPSSSTATISTQTEPPLPIITLPDSSPVPIFEPQIPATFDSAPFDWANDTSLSTLPLIVSKQSRDLSSLRSSSKNPFSSLRRRHHYLKHPKIISSHCYTQFHPTHSPFHHTPPLTNLNWHHDPRLSELSRVLRSLGWSHP